MPLTARHKIRTVAIIVMVAYTILRFFAIRAFFEQYGVNPWIFLAIDCVTAVTYVIAIEHLIVGLITKKVEHWFVTAGWAFLAFASFAAPYGYVFLVGKTIPSGLGLGLGIVVILLLLNALVVVFKRVRSRPSK